MTAVEPDLTVVDVFVDDRGAHGNPLGITWASPATRGHEQRIAADLGFSETCSSRRSPARDGDRSDLHPGEGAAVRRTSHRGAGGLAAPGGQPIEAIDVPPGRVRVRMDGDLVFVTAQPEWAPEFALDRLGSAAEVDAVDPGLRRRTALRVGVAGRVGRAGARADVRAGMGIREDEATGAAAVRLTAELRRDLEILQGRGSVIHTRVHIGPGSGGRRRVSGSRSIELPVT